MSKTYAQLLEKTRAEGECRVWQGWIKGAGSSYGVTYASGRPTLVHRYVYQLHHGEIPEGKCICHSCDNPGCINIDHLFIGTWADNNRDRAKKGRNANTHGEKHPRAKLTNDQAREIKQLLRTTNCTQKEIGARFGVSWMVVAKIKEGKNWSSVQ